MYGRQCLTPRAIRGSWLLITCGLLFGWSAAARADDHPGVGANALPLIGYTESRNDLEGGQVTRLTTSPPGTRHYHPAVSPDGKWVLFGSDRSGTMQLYVAMIDGTDLRPITDVPDGHAAMHGHWQPVRATATPSSTALPK